MFQASTRVRLFTYDLLVGGTRLDSRTIVCEVRCADDRVYKVRSFVTNAFVIEMNQRIVENPQLLASKVPFTNA